MTEQNRRHFLGRASVGAAAAVGAAAPPHHLKGTATSGPDRVEARPNTSGADRGVLHGPLMAYVPNPGKDEMSVRVGTQAVVYRDRELAARLSPATSRGRLA